MASGSDGAELTDEEIAGLTDAELVGRYRLINAEILGLVQIYLRDHPGGWLAQHCLAEPDAVDRLALALAVSRSVPDADLRADAQFERIQRIKSEMGLRLGETLRAARLFLGLTLQDVGRVAGIHSRFVDEIEQGRRSWSMSPDLFERACTEGQLARADCTGSLAVWFPLADPRICRTIREVAVDPAWLTNKDGAAATLARSIRDGRSFDLLPILGDALEEAGCGDLGLLAHCRNPGLHARGCWVVDALVRAGRRG